MVAKFKIMRAVSLVCALASIAMSFLNFNGAYSEPLRGNSIMFGGVLTIPVVVALIALVLSLMCWGIIRTLEAQKKEEEKDATQG